MTEDKFLSWPKAFFTGEQSLFNINALKSFFLFFSKHKFSAADKQLISYNYNYFYEVRLMKERIAEFEAVLDQEEKILDSLVHSQDLLKKAVTDKNWESLTKIINNINTISSDFLEADTSREVLQDMMKMNEIKPYFERLGNMRAKLLKCKIENQALSKYVNITKNFIQGVVDNALPQSRNKVYSKNGKIVQPQPQSVVLNLDF